MMTEQLLATEVSLAAPLALRERRKLRGWRDAVYYLQLEDGRMMVLRLVEGGQKLGVYHFDTDTCRADTPSICTFVRGHSKGKTIALSENASFPAKVSYPAIQAVFACSRELQTAAEVKGLRTARREVKPNLIMYEELTEYDLIEAREGTWFYATRQGQVFRFTLQHNARYTRIKLEELYVNANTPPRVMYLDQGSGPSKRRPSRRQNEGATWKGSIGPFQNVFSSDMPMTANEIRDHFHLAGRHKSQQR